MVCNLEIDRQYDKRLQLELKPGIIDKQKKIPETAQFYVDPVQLKQYKCNINSIEMLENQADKYELSSQ